MVASALHVDSAAYCGGKHHAGQESIVKSTRALKSVSVLDRRSVSQQIRELSQRYGLAVDPDAYVRDLAWASSSASRLLRRCIARRTS